jgi:hypothetical protein
VNEDWNVQVGELRPVGRGPHSRDHLFKYVAEKLPWAALSLVSAYLKTRKVKRVGVYMAHDSFGVARYGGRGNIFSRLRTHKRKYSKELVYFSFYIIENKTHEREIENVILRAAGPQMVLNNSRFATASNQEGLVIMNRAQSSFGGDMQEVQNAPRGSDVLDVSVRVALPGRQV